MPIIADATSAIKVSTAGLGSSFSALAPIFGAVLAPAAVVAGYKVVATTLQRLLKTTQNWVKATRIYINRGKTPIVKFHILKT